MEVDIAGETRTSIYLNSVPGLEEGAEVATEVTVPGSGIICERAMYFDYESGIGARSGGHATIGAPSLSGSWYLPEGYTGGDFDTFLLLMNPGTEDANATVKLMKPGEGKYYPFKVVVPAGKRVTVKLDDLVWTEGTDNIIAANTEPPADPVQVSFDNTDVSTAVYPIRASWRSVPCTSITTARRAAPTPSGLPARLPSGTCPRGIPGRLRHLGAGHEPLLRHRGHHLHLLLQPARLRALERSAQRGPALVARFHQRGCGPRIGGHRRSDQR